MSEIIFEEGEPIHQPPISARRPNAKRRIMIAFPISLLLHLAFFALLPGFDVTSSSTEDLNEVYTEVLFVPNDEDFLPKEEQPLPESEGFVSITEETLPGFGNKMKQGYSLFDPNPVIAPPKIDMDTDLDVKIPDDKLLPPSSYDRNISLYKNSVLPEGLFEGKNDDFDLTGPGIQKEVPGSLINMDRMDKIIPKDFPTSQKHYTSANVEGPVAERVISKPPLPKLERGKNISIKLKFWVRPDGWVGKVVPLTKGDAKLEELSIDYLKRWRFSPLPEEVEQVNQWGLITITFRTK